MEEEQASPPRQPPFRPSTLKEGIEGSTGEGRRAGTRTEQGDARWQGRKERSGTEPTAGLISQKQNRGLTASWSNLHVELNLGDSGVPAMGGRLEGAGTAGTSVPQAATWRFLGRPP